VPQLDWLGILDAYKVEFVVVEEDAFDPQQVDVEAALLLLLPVARLCSINS